MSGIYFGGGGDTMTGREDRRENDLFFTCSLIEYIARRTKNKRSVVVNSLGKNLIEKIYDLKETLTMFPLPVLLFQAIGISGRYIRD